MGFLDKVKAGAEQAVQQGQQALQQGQDKLDEVQAKKKADALLRDLGAWHYAIETGRDEGDAAGEIARIMGELQAHEATNGPIPVGRTEPATFMHHPLIMKTPTQKLSKSDGDTGVREMRARLARNQQANTGWKLDGGELVNQ